MPIRTPLVIIDGKVQELPIGDTIAGAPAGAQGPPGNGIQSSTATAGENILQGQVVYLNGTSLMVALADSISTAKAVGVCTVSATIGNQATYVTEGLVTLLDWTNAVGSTALTKGDRYFLDPTTPGLLTTVAPTASGHIVIAIGVATEAQILDLILSQPIQL